MSRFFSQKYAFLEPYVPGEQPQDKKYVKLNTNESPFPPSDKAKEMAAEAAQKLNLYSDPECRLLCEAIADHFGIRKENIMVNNGSDESLNFSFMAFCDEEHPAYFPDITYGFYPVFAQINRLPYKEIPLKDDMSIDLKDYLPGGQIDKPGTIYIANPNAPTGIALELKDIEAIVSANPESVVVVDEAYVDFGAESAVSLVEKYDNLLVVQTFSKSRSMAGARLGFAIGCKELLQDLHTVRYSTNPYNVNSMTLAAGIGAMADETYTRQNAKTIQENRTYTLEKLSELGFSMTDSKANFLFASHAKVDGESIYRKLKERGVLVRHFSKERIKNYNRITIGTREQMDILLQNLREILEDERG